MAIDINKVRSALNSQKTFGQRKSNRSEVIWKPVPGKQTIRIVPNKYSPDYPFVELSFYYFVQNRSFLCPASLGHPDPIMDKIKLLESTGVYSDKQIARALKPKTRIYAPILVRGKEYEGVKLWGFSPTIYTKLCTYIDGEYGDITDLQTGTDIDIMYTGRGSGENAFPKMEIFPKRTSTLAFNPEDTQLREKFQNQVNVRDLFEEPTYEELQEALERWLNPEGTVDPGNVTNNTFTNAEQTSFTNNPFDNNPFGQQPQRQPQQQFAPTPQSVQPQPQYQNPVNESHDVDQRFKDMFA